MMFMKRFITFLLLFCFVGSNNPVFSAARAAADAHLMELVNEVRAHDQAAMRAEGVFGRIGAAMGAPMAAVAAVGIGPLAPVLPAALTTQDEIQNYIRARRRAGIEGRVIINELLVRNIPFYLVESAFVAEERLRVGIMNSLVNAARGLTTRVASRENDLGRFRRNAGFAKFVADYLKAHPTSHGLVSGAQGAILRISRLRICEKSDEEIKRIFEEEQALPVLINYAFEANKKEREMLSIADEKAKKDFFKRERIVEKCVDIRQEVYYDERMKVAASFKEGRRRWDNGGLYVKYLYRNPRGPGFCSFGGECLSSQTFDLEEVWELFDFYNNRANGQIVAFEYSTVGVPSTTFCGKTREQVTALIEASVENNYEEIRNVIASPRLDIYEDPRLEDTLIEHDPVPPLDLAPFLDRPIEVMPTKSLLTPRLVIHILCESEAAAARAHLDGFRSTDDMSLRDRAEGIIACVCCNAMGSRRNFLRWLCGCSQRSCHRGQPHGGAGARDDSDDEDDRRSDFERARRSGPQRGDLFPRAGVPDDSDAE